MKTDYTLNSESDGLFQGRSWLFSASFLVVTFIIGYILFGYMVAGDFSNTGDISIQANRSIAYFAPLFTITAVYFGVLLKRTLGKVFSIEKIKVSWLDKALLSAVIITMGYCMARLQTLYSHASSSYTHASFTLFGVAFFLTAVLITKNPAGNKLYEDDNLISLRVSTFSSQKIFCNLTIYAHRTIMNIVSSMYLVGVLVVIGFNL